MKNTLMLPPSPGAHAAIGKRQTFYTLRRQSTAMEPTESDGSDHVMVARRFIQSGSRLHCVECVSPRHAGIDLPYVSFSGVWFSSARPWVQPEARRARSGSTTGPQFCKSTVQATSAHGVHESCLNIMAAALSPSLPCKGVSMSRLLSYPQVA